MAHEIDTTTGTAAFYSLRKPAWHGLGTVVNEPASTPDILKLARMDWTVEKVPLLARVPDLGIDAEGSVVEVMGEVEVPSHRAVRRTDTGAILGVVGADWTPVQNEQLFAWLNALGSWGDLTVETAGCLDNGRTVWALARMDALQWEMDSVDVIRPYLLLSNGHAGQRALTIMPTTVRVVCANTLRMSDRQTDRRHAKKGDGLAAGWKLHHTTDIGNRMEEARDILVRTTEAWKTTTEEFTRLAESSFDAGMLDEIVAKVWKGEDDEPTGKRGAQIAAERLGKIRHLLEAPTNTTTSARGSAWGALNAITEFLDHETKVRATVGKDPQEARFASSQFGRADVLKGRAWKLVRESIAA